MVASILHTERMGFEHPERFRDFGGDLWLIRRLLRALFLPAGFICVAETQDIGSIGGHSQLYWGHAGKHIRIHEGRPCEPHSVNNFDTNTSFSTISPRVSEPPPPPFSPTCAVCRVACGMQRHADRYVWLQSDLSPDRHLQVHNWPGGVVDGTACAFHDHCGDKHTPCTQIVFIGTALDRKEIEDRYGNFFP